jgi:hypothetical protein
MIREIDLIEDKTIANAILDRIIHSSIRFELKSRIDAKKNEKKLKI